MAHIYNGILLNGILLSHRKEWNMPFAAIWMDLETEWRKAERERQMTYDIIYMWGIKKWYK